MKTSNWDPTISKDRATGMFAAHFVGDALGAPFEFSWGKLNEFTGKLDRQLQCRSRWQDPKYGPIGQTTDDTAMTLTLFNVLYENDGNYDVDTSILAYHEWASGATMVGRNTRQLLKFKALPKNVVTCYKRRWNKKFSDPEAAKNQLSNGCLMRCLPFTLLEEWETSAHDDCFLTNPSEQAWEYEKLYIHGMKELLRGKSRSEVLGELPSLTDSVEIKDLLQENDCNLRHNKGWIKNAFFCFLWALRWEGTLSEFLYQLIKKGGDTDTNAAIAGAALGVSFGMKALMSDEIFSQSWLTVTKVDVSESEIDSRQEYQGRNLELELSKIL